MLLISLLFPEREVLSFFKKLMAPCKLVLRSKDLVRFRKTFLARKFHK